MQSSDANALLVEGKIVSLSQGNILDKKQRLVGYLGIATVCLFPVLTVVLLLIPQVEWDFSLAVLMGICDVAAVAFISLMAFIIVKNKKLCAKIAPWLENAVEIKAYSKKIGENRLGIQPKATKIQVRFNYNGVVYKRESTAKVFGGQEGYVGCFNKYADREVDVLYSFEYNEVLILKI